MIAYREVINDENDLKKVYNILKNLKQQVEVIILPIEKTSNNKEFISMQSKALESTWDNQDDKVWDDL